MGVETRTKALADGVGEVLQVVLSSWSPLVAQCEVEVAEVADWRRPSGGNKRIVKAMELASNAIDSLNAR